MLRIGNQTNSYLNRENGKIDYAALSRHGFTHADYQSLAVTDGALYQMSESDMIAALHTEKALAASNGIAFSQVHAPWPVVDRTEEERAQTLAFMKRAVVGTNALGSPYLVVHPVMPFGWDPEPDSALAYQINADYFAALCDFALDYDVGICIENMPTLRHTIARIPSLVRFVNELNRKNFHICLDTGHCHYTGDNCGDAVRACGSLLKTLHVHDNTTHFDDHLMPFFGTINWKNFKAALRDIGFDGVLSIEANVPYLPADLREQAFLLLAQTTRSLADI